ncbi:MAG: hypothetical protein Q9226_008613 [Calogaya cf. arnoldii]
MWILSRTIETLKEMLRYLISSKDKEDPTYVPEPPLVWPKMSHPLVNSEKAYIHTRFNTKDYIWKDGDLFAELDLFDLQEAKMRQLASDRGNSREMNEACEQWKQELKALGELWNEWYGAILNGP